MLDLTYTFPSQSTSDKQEKVGLPQCFLHPGLWSKCSGVEQRAVALTVRHFHLVIFLAHCQIIKTNSFNEEKTYFAEAYIRKTVASHRRNWELGFDGPCGSLPFNQGIPWSVQECWITPSCSTAQSISWGPCACGDMGHVGEGLTVPRVPLLFWVLRNLWEALCAPVQVGFSRNVTFWGQKSCFLLMDDNNNNNNKKCSLRSIFAGIMLSIIDFPACHWADMMITMRSEILPSELQGMSSIPDLAPAGFSATGRSGQ